jgi:cell division protein FtsW
MLDATMQRRHKPDYMLIVLATILLGLGLIVVYAISPGLSEQRNVGENYFIGKQFTAILIGIAAFAVAAHMPLARWKHFLRPLIMVAGAATLIALITPVTPEYPAHRWIRFGGLSLQSVELIKFAILFWLSYFLADRVKEGNLDNFEKTFKPILIGLVILGVVVAGAQKDLGSTGVLVAMGGVMAFVAGLPLKRVLTIGAIIAAGTFLLVMSSGYRRDRVLTFLNPERDCQNAGYQACQALIAVGSGGIKGKGLAHSVQAYGYLPEAANDSIFAIFAEKFGFIGSTILVGLFIAFFTRIKNIMERAPDMMTRLVVVGILAWLSTQAFINIGAMVGLLPLKGITLPFISYGGTSIIFVLGAIGVVFNISRYTTYGANNIETPQNPNDHSSNWRRQRRPSYAHISRRP